MVTVSQLAPMRIPHSTVKASSDSLAQSLKEFLEKPVIVQSGSFTAADTVSSFAGVNFPSFYNTIDLYLQKFKGNYGVRMDLCFRLVVNANRFQQGRYLLTWVPSGGADTSLAKYTAWHNAHIYTLVQRTQLPHAEIDINCDTEVEFNVPYSNAFNFTNVNETVFQGQWVSGMGRVQIFPYSPLVSASGSTSCGYTLWVSAKNIELFGAVVPQSGYSSKVKKRSPSEVEQASIGGGPISSALMKIKKTADLMSSVPLLSAYGTQVSWMAELGAKAASIFGFSKPINLEKATRIERQIYQYNANCDGPVNAAPLSYSYKNELANLPGFAGSDVDEMDFKFLVTIPAWTYTVNWDTTKVSGDVIYVGYTGVRDGLNTTTVNGDIFGNYLPYQLVAEHFDYWRGSFVFRIKIVKTEFHSGRLAVSYQPSDNVSGTATTPSLTNASYIHREIIDVREGNEFTFVVPYIATAPYTLRGDNTGIFSVQVLDALVAPATVSSSVTLLVERCMGPDTEFAVPLPAHFMPVMNVTPQMASKEENVCARVDSYMGSSKHSDDNNETSAACIGEKVVSLRFMMKRYMNNAIFYVPTLGAKYINVFPFIQNYMYTSGVTNTPASAWPDLLGIWSSCYVYSRGGMRYRFVEDAFDLSNNVLLTQPYYYNSVTNGCSISTGGTTSINSGNTFVNPLAQVHYSLKQDTHEVQVPGYWKLYSKINSQQWTNSASTFAATLPYVNGYSLTHTSKLQATALKPLVLRAANEDFHFGGFLSVPPMFTSSSTGNFNTFT